MGPAQVCRKCAAREGVGGVGSLMAAFARTFAEKTNPFSKKQCTIVLKTVPLSPTREGRKKGVREGVHASQVSPFLAFLLSGYVETPASVFDALSR